MWVCGRGRVRVRVRVSPAAVTRAEGPKVLARPRTDGCEELDLDAARGLAIDLEVEIDPRVIGAARLLERHGSALGKATWLGFGFGLGLGMFECEG